MYPFKIFDFYRGLKNRDAYSRLKRIDNRYLKKTNTGMRGYILLDLHAFLRGTFSVKDVSTK